MQQTLIDAEERKVRNDWSANFRGTVLVRLEVLNFDAEGCRKDNRHNVERLKGIFHEEGCLNLKPQNRIPATISHRSLLDAIQISPEGTTLATLLENPLGIPPDLRLPPNHHLKCLQGRSRTQAAKEFLAPIDRVWAVDLYLEDASQELRTMLIEEYSNAASFSDGEIYQKMHHYRGNIFARGRWRARLSGSKQRDLKHFHDHSAFTAAFDKLLVIPGLWSHFRISMTRKFMATKCDDVILYRLSLIWKFWFSLVGGDLELMGLADETTVKALELRVPGLCSDDAKFLEGLMEDGVLFPNLRNQERRQNIWSNLQKTTWLIPSMYTFFEDIKYFIPCANIMKQLLGKEIKGTVNEALRDSFSGVNQNEGAVRVQETESSFRSYRGSRADQISFGIFQLWQFPPRELTRMTGECPKKEKGQKTPVPQTPEVSAWTAFATLAYNLGFESDEIHRLRSKDSDREIARAALLEARNPRHFKYEEMAFESYQSQIAGFFAAASPISSPPITPALFVDDPGECLERRCGRTFENAYEFDRERFFLKAFHPPTQGGGKGITSLFVRVSVFLAFFGSLVYSDANEVDAYPTHLLGLLATPEILALDTQQDRQMVISSQRLEQEARSEDEADRLRNQLQRAGENHTYLTQKIRELEENIDFKDRMVREIQQEASQLRIQVERQENWKREAERASAELGELQNYRSFADNRIEELNNVNLTLREEQESWAETSEKTVGENQQLSARCADLMQQLETMEVAAYDTSEELRWEINDLKQSLDRSNTFQRDTSDENVTERKRLLANNKELRQQNERLQLENKETKHDLETINITQSVTLNEILVEKERLSGVNEELCRQYEILTAENGKLQQDLEDCEKLMSMESEALKEATTDNKVLRDRYEALMYLKKRYALVENERVEIEKRTQDLEDQVAKMKSQCREEIERVKETASRELKDIEERNRTLKEQLTRIDKAREQSASQLTRETSRNKVLQQKNADLTNLNDEVTREIEELNRTFQEQVMRAKHEVVQQTTTDLASLHEKAIAVIKEENRTLRTQLTRTGRLQLDNKIKSDKIDILESELASLRDETNWLIISRTFDEEIPGRDVGITDPLARVINFKTIWKDRSVIGQSLLLSAAEVESLGNKSIRKGIHMYTIKDRGLSPKNAFETVVDDGTYTIVMKPEGEHGELAEEAEGPSTKKLKQK